MNKIKLLIVDDHTIFRQGIEALLSKFEDIEVVGVAGNGKEAVRKAKLLSPDVITMDINMPEMNGIEATKRILKNNPGTAVLILTQYENIEYITLLLKAGVRGYITKTADIVELEVAIRRILIGETYLSPSAMTAFVNEYKKQLSGYQDEYEQLSSRERKIIQLIAEGLTSREIADNLLISVKTVLRGRASLMKKLGFHGRADVVKYATSRGLIEVTESYKTLS